MKIYIQLLFLSVIMLITSISVQAQQSEMPPSRVNVKFNAKYPQLAGKATWTQENKEYAATFTDKGRQTTSRFSEEGRWLGSQTQLKEADWQKPTRQYLTENHEGYKYLEGYRFDDDKGTRYQVDVQAKTGGRYRLMFDGKGSFINEKPIQD